jgi:hypothetical protein
MSLLRPVAHRQLVLLDWPRDLRAGMRAGFPHVPDLALEAALHEFTREHAARHSWARGKAERVQRGIRIMPAIQDIPGAAIRRSDVALLSAIKHSAAVVADVLAQAGMLAEDREPVIVRWFTAETSGLPEQMRHELGTWFDMRHGSSTAPRRQHHRHPAPLRPARLEGLGQDTRLAARDQPRRRARRPPARRAAARAHADGPAVDLQGPQGPQAGVHQPHRLDPPAVPGQARPRAGRPGRASARRWTARTRSRRC